MPRLSNNAPNGANLIVDDKAVLDSDYRANRD